MVGDGLANSLINPNQCRMNGIELCDDPFDPNRTLGIKDPLTDTNIPMDFENSFVYMTTRASTLDKIRTLLTVVMTDEAPWVPSKAGRKQLSCEEEEKRALIGNVKINEYTVNCTRPDEPQLHLDEAEYDILLVSCSAEYSKQTLIQRLVLLVRIASCYKDEGNLTEDEIKWLQWTREQGIMR
jgi:hypothetical protein